MNDTFSTDDDVYDELSKLLNQKQKNTRLDIWLWLYLYKYESYDLDPSTCNSTSMRKTIASFLTRNLNIIEKIISKKDQHLLPDKYFRWIEKDDRQYQWLRPRIENITNFILPQGLVHLFGANRLIAMLDLWDVDTANKEKANEHLRQSWLARKSMDIDFEWFEDKKDGTKRCKCAWEWLHKSHPQLPPINNHIELLIFFDQADLGRNEQKAMIQQIKKRWNRKQFDERAANKKQVNVMLSKTVISQLDELAKRYDLKRAQVIEILVRGEAETGMYLAED